MAAPLGASPGPTADALAQARAWTRPPTWGMSAPAAQAEVQG